MRPIDFITVSEITAPPAHLAVAQADSPFGPLLLAGSAMGLTHIWLNEDGQAMQRMAAAMPKIELVTQSSPHHKAALTHFGRTPQPLALHLKGTPFQMAVWRALLDIPYGATSSYKAVAEKIGKPKATRAVGSAIGKNPIFFVIPCHRVLATGGGLGGYFWGLPVKQKILAFEGSA